MYVCMYLYICISTCIRFIPIGINGPSGLSHLQMGTSDGVTGATFFSGMILQVNGNVHAL